MRKWAWLLVAHHGHLAQGAAAIVDRPPPAQPATLVDQLDVAVTLRGGGLGRVARHRADDRMGDHGLLGETGPEDVR